MKFASATLLLQALVFHHQWKLSTGCSASANYVLPSVGPLAAPGPPAPHIVGTVAGLQAWTVGIGQYETPIALRFTHLVDMLNWNCVASYSLDWKDATTRGSALLNTPATTTLTDGSTIGLHNSDTRLLCMANAWATVVQDWVPEAEDPLAGYFSDFAYPDIQSGYDTDVDACFDIDGDGAADLDCVSTIAASHCYAPSIMGAIIGRQLTEYARRDGWNMFGELNRLGLPCTANCRRYTDPTGYDPKNVPGTTFWRRKWQPLLEDDGRGYFTRQEHVTPHIGFTAKPAVITQADLESRTVSNPWYNYDVEAEKVLERLAQLDDHKKMLIEFFDNKIAVAFAVVGAVAAQGATFEQIINFALGYTGAEIDAITVAWKSKVETDLVRPTTWIQDELGHMLFETWGGPFQGTKIIKGADFESYIRVMPHSEFVSGSGCLCQAVYELTDFWLQDKLGISGSIAVPLPTFTAGSSKTEPGLTPSEDITVVLPDMITLRDTCGNSRLDGGMHFEASVPASYQLCAGIGVEAFHYAKSLWENDQQD